MNTPIVFVHGNSDGALTDGSKYGTGWTSSISYFLSKGYTSAELYATTWGDRNSTNAYLRTHNCETIARIRLFMEAVLLYTNSNQINVISHSMGVAIARKAIRGGILEADDGSCELGPSIRAKINVFIGISGANYGMCQCAGGNKTAIYPTCNKKNGFWPGEPCTLTPLRSPQELCGSFTESCCGNSYSQLLQEMNEDPYNEAQNVFSYWSHGKCFASLLCEISLNLIQYFVIMSRQNEQEHVPQIEVFQSTRSILEKRCETSVDMDLYKY